MGLGYTSPQYIAKLVDIVESTRLRRDKNEKLGALI
jgi:hypothetical protein